MQLWCKRSYSPPIDSLSRLTADLSISSLLLLTIFGSVDSAEQDLGTFQIGFMLTTGRHTGQYCQTVDHTYI